MGVCGWVLMVGWLICWGMGSDCGGVGIGRSFSPLCTPHHDTTSPNPLYLYTHAMPMHRHLVITSLAAGHRHLLLVTADGAVLAAGSNSMGQLGLPGKGGGTDILMYICIYISVCSIALI